MKNRFQVIGQFGFRPRITRGTVTIDRDSGIFTVRPHKSRRTYSVALSLVAEIISERVAKAEIRIAAKEKKHRKDKSK